MSIVTSAIFKSVVIISNRKRYTKKFKVSKMLIATQIINEGSDILAATSSSIIEFRRKVIHRIRRRMLAPANKYLLKLKIDSANRKLVTASKMKR